MRTGNIAGGARWVFLALLGSAALLGPGCEGPVEPELTDGELIRQLLDTGTDEAILFSSAVLRDQTGVNAYARTVDSIMRGFRQVPRIRIESTLVGSVWEYDTLLDSVFFYTDTLESQGPELAFQADIMDTLYGTVTYRIGQTTRSLPYNRLVLHGRAKFLRLGATSSRSNPWYIWRMQYRYAEALAGDGSPAIGGMTISYNGVVKPVVPRDSVRIIRDEVLTVPPGVLSAIRCSLTVNTPNDSFFVTYPVAGGYETVAMNHLDLFTHVATVEVLSTRRYELLAVQGFKREAFTESDFPEATATAVQTAILRFYSP